MQRRVKAEKLMVAHTSQAAAPKAATWFVDLGGHRHDRSHGPPIFLFRSNSLP
jgi:hypothetical protein